MRMILPKGSIALEDDDKISKHEEELKNESELYVVFQLGDGVWEQVSIKETEGSGAGD